MSTEAQRNPAYAEAQANHPDPQLRPLLEPIYGPSLSRLRAEVAQEGQETEVAPSVSGGGNDIKQLPERKDAPSHQTPTS